jgi:hypothetical protein
MIGGVAVPGGLGLVCLVLSEPRSGDMIKRNALNTRRIYVSARESIVSLGSKELVFDEQAKELLKRLEEKGFEVFWEKEFRRYEIIEREIAACDALLAIIDNAWGHSTWMASEVTFAVGLGGSTKNRIMSPIPVFLYPVVEKWIWRWLKDYPGVTILDRDIGKAVCKISSVLGGKHTPQPGQGIHL